MSDIQTRVEAAQREAFLRRVGELTHENSGTLLPAGELGFEMGLPYEQLLAIVEDLQTQGLLHREDELMPPQGPMVHITGRGIDFIHRSQAA